MPTRRVTQQTHARGATIGAALTLAISVSVSGCGSASSTATEPTSSGPGSSSTTSSPPPERARPATGPVLSAQGFSFHAPKGWTDVTDRSATGVLLSAAHPADEQPLAITVRHLTPGARTAAAARARATAILQAAGAARIHVLGDTRVAGNPAAHVVGVQNLRGTHYQLDVFYVRTSGAAWPLLFATNQYTTDERRDAMLASVLETCHWQKA
jgi:hypothetical protein